jgi:hypothetical protein
MRQALTTVICAIVGSVALVSCAQRPLVALKWPGYQEKADATHDWEVVAHKIAMDMIQRDLLPDPNKITANASEPEHPPYYIDVTIPSSQFQHEVRQSLQSEILQYGGSVVARPSHEALTLVLDANVVYWPSAYSLHDGAPSTEVAWEASITSNNQIIFDVRYPMYVSELDVLQYSAVPVGPSPVRLRYTP